MPRRCTYFAIAALFSTTDAFMTQHIELPLARLVIMRLP